MEDRTGPVMSRVRVGCYSVFSTGLQADERLHIEARTTVQSPF